MISARVSSPQMWLKCKVIAPACNGKRPACLSCKKREWNDVVSPHLSLPSLCFHVACSLPSTIFCELRADLQSRDPEIFKPLHIINMTIKDSFEESAAAAGHVLELCRTVNIHSFSTNVLGSEGDPSIPTASVNLVCGRDGGFSYVLLAVLGDLS